MSQDESIVKKNAIINLWKEYYEELVKVKRAISNSLYDVAINPLEKAKIILKELEIAKEPKVKARYHELMVFEFMLCNYLKNRTRSPLEDKKMDLRFERYRAMLAAEKAIDRNDEEAALNYLKKAKSMAEQLSNFNH
ncbi:MAG: hypothetical protein EAX96_12065 [Candidatus Lokiarchaeota archaeon]|nr:hypothetical protein [Candidatus Lokiarchaeota archaeon]